jgi:hypothetical protein
VIVLLAGSNGAQTISPSAERTRVDHYVVLEFLDPAVGHVGEFESWWPTHLKRVLATEGLTSVAAYERSSTQLPRPSAALLPGYLAIYSFTSTNLLSIDGRLRAEIGKLNPVVDRDSARIYLYRHTGEWKSADSDPAGDLFRQMVFGNAFRGREDDFNSWYNGTHAADLVTVPGVVAVNRFVFSETFLDASQPPPKYLSMMDFRTGSVDRFSEVLDRVSAHFANTDAFDASHAWRLLYKQVEDESGKFRN